MGWVQLVFIFLSSLVRCRAELAAENLALRQQLAILKEKVKLPRLHPRDRIFWVWLSKFWPSWRSVLVIVQPATVVRWHRQGPAGLVEQPIALTSRFSFVPCHGGRSHTRLNRVGHPRTIGTCCVKNGKCQQIWCEWAESSERGVNGDVQAHALRASGRCNPC